MRDEDYAKLLEDTQRELLASGGPAGVLGLTPVTLRLLASLAPAGLDRAVTAIYTQRGSGRSESLLTVPVRPFAESAIVFDHFTGIDRFRYTLGERIAGRGLLGDPCWLHLHGTGVFYRQQAAR